MRFKGQFRGIFVDLIKYERLLDVYLGGKLEESARIWLTAVTGRVPLWSGMARASLLELAQLVNGRIILSPLKAPSRVPQGSVLGSATFNNSGPDYFFEITTKVSHYVEQEFQNVGVSKTAPWRSFAIGQAAWLEFARNIRLPPPIIKGRVIKRVS
jgi:hypothetical protein